jgi:hypothetical protein
MKTSTKLLIGFSGTLVLLMLFSVIILRADYSKGITNTAHYESSVAHDPDSKKETLQPFKVLVLGQEGASSNQRIQTGSSSAHTQTTSIQTVAVQHGNSYILEHHSNITFHQSGDTLYVFISKPGDITVTCPALETINSNYNNLNISDLKLPQLNVYTGPETFTDFDGNRITTLSFTGGPASTLSLENQNTIDTVRIKLGKASSLKLGDLAYRFSDIKVDSLRELEISGKGLNNITQIK